MRKKLLAIFLGLGGLFFFSQPSFSLENIRAATASLTSPSVLYLLVAQREGYFRAEGLNVEIITMRGEVAVKIAVASEVDFFTQAGSALAAAVRGVPVRILMVADDKPPWELVAQPHITSVAQLKGGTIGVLSFEGSVAVATKQILRRNGLDPARDVTLMVMGGNDVRLVALRGKAIQATLLDPANSFRAQKEGFSKLASAGDYVTHYLGGGIVVAEEKMKQSSERIGKFIEASLKGLLFFLNRREAAIGHMMDLLKVKDREAVAAIYDSSVRVMTRDGIPEEKGLQGLIEDMKKTTGTKKEFRITDIFDFSFARKANEKLKTSGWRP